MREQQIQARKIKELEAEGYYVIKLVSTNKNGIPDLIAIPRDSDVLFVEVKAPGGRVSKLQQYRYKELKSHGIRVEIYGNKKTNRDDRAGDGVPEEDC